MNSLIRHNPFKDVLEHGQPIRVRSWGVAGKPALFAPGGRDWNCSSTSYTLAALRIEKVTGRSNAAEM
jgi:hypothetical protein